MIYTATTIALRPTRRATVKHAPQDTLYDLPPIGTPGTTAGLEGTTLVEIHRATKDDAEHCTVLWLEDGYVPPPIKEHPLR